ncbi:hypothetical protein ERW51_18035 [Aliivibrio finisterrensis]|nr:hypothetical protein ERW54_18575 [Aliivibrio finisterrensis]RYU67410.1 hypothetical protein ERW51_18035 [Aliivibrio finisterrensis]RYU70314.1 hypothetical protein ERW48_18305 [Aliivibrio finisterrensis]
MLFLTPFERFGFSLFGTDKPNIIATIGIKNTESNALMLNKMRQNHEQLKRELASEIHELREIRANLPNLMK